jgi:hypothetical protein
MPGRGMQIELHYKNKQVISIIGVYIPASCGTERNSVNQWAIERISHAQARRHKIIVLGDFNSIVNPQADKQSITVQHPANNNPTSSILKFLHHSGFVDTYRETYPFVNKFTWHNSRNTHTRIDMIWISASNEWDLLDADIVPSSFLTHSDHDIVTCKLEVSDTIQQYPSCTYTTSPIYNTKKMSTKQWSKFQEMVNTELTAQEQKYDVNKLTANKLWNITWDAINKAMCAHVTKNKKHSNQSPINRGTSMQALQVIRLKKLIHATEKAITRDVPSEVQVQQIKKLCEKLNRQESIISNPPWTATSLNTVNMKSWITNLKSM